MQLATGRIIFFLSCIPFLIESPTEQFTYFFQIKVGLLNKADTLQG